jgi:phospholipid/cholesterol/gamma-HCH transport system ATP-binding protein
MTEPLIEFKNVGKRFGNRTIMDQVNLKIYEGEITTIIGKSGSGKSVLLKHLIGLLKPEEGSVFFRGTPLERMGRKQWDAYLGQISYMFQNNALFDSLSVFENVAMPLRENTRLSQSDIEAAAWALKPDVDCFEFSVYAGLARGHPNVELESISEIAEFKQKPIGRFQCGLNTKGPANLN